MFQESMGGVPYEGLVVVVMSFKYLDLTLARTLYVYRI